MATDARVPRAYLINEREDVVEEVQSPGDMLDVRLGHRAVLILDGKPIRVLEPGLRQLPPITRRHKRSAMVVPIGDIPLTLVTEGGYFAVRSARAPTIDLQFDIRINIWFRATDPIGLARVNWAPKEYLRQTTIAAASYALASIDFRPKIGPQMTPSDEVVEILNRGTQDYFARTSVEYGLTVSTVQVERPAWYGDSKVKVDELYMLLLRADATGTAPIVLHTMEIRPEALSHVTPDTTVLGAKALEVIRERGGEPGVMCAIGEVMERTGLPRPATDDGPPPPQPRQLGAPPRIQIRRLPAPVATANQRFAAIDERLRLNPEPMLLQATAQTSADQRMVRLKVDATCAYKARLEIQAREDELTVRLHVLRVEQVDDELIGLQSFEKEFFAAREADALADWIHSKLAPYVKY
jgi:hypothetical protein